MKITHTIKSFLLFAAILSAASYACKLDKVDEPQNPSCSGADAVTAEFEADKSSCEVPCEITFTNKSEGASNYSWNFDNNQGSLMQNPGKVLFNTAGNYTVTLIASNNKGCADTSEMVIVIVDPQLPTIACANITAQTNGGRAPSSFSFSTACTQNASTYNWDFGDPGSGAANNGVGPTAQHLYNNPGQYTVKLLVVGPMVSDDTTFTVTVKPPGPQAAFTLVNNGCDAPCPIQFTNTSQNAVSYQWDFGNGGNSVLTSPSQIYTDKGVYTVRLIATAADGAKDTAFQDVTILKLPIADFTFTNNNCVGPCTVTFAENSQFETSYIWNFGDGSPISTIANPTHNYTTKGTYFVRLIAINPDGSDTINKSVTILSPQFKAVIDINGADVSPLYGVQRSDGQLHVLFEQVSVYKSVLISPSKTVGNIVSYNFTDLNDLNEIIDSDEGGFALMGSDAGSTRATLVKISSSQGTSFSRIISFTGNSQLSQGQGAMLSVSNSFVVTGSYIPTGGGDMFPGFAFVSQTGALSGNTFVNVPVSTMGAVYAEGIAQLSSGQFVLIANQWSLGGTPKRYLIRTSSTGTYQSNVNLGTSATVQVFQIQSVNNDVFVLQSISGVRTLVKYNSALASQGSISLTNTSVAKILIAPDGNLIVCGTKNNNLWMAKYNSSSMSSTPIWERSYSETSGTSSGISVASLANGGYLLTGLHTSATNQKRLYLVKTDSAGNTD